MMADGTGFSPDAISNILVDFRRNPIDPSGWSADSMFSGTSSSILPRLVGVMMNVPQIHEALEAIGGTGDAHRRIAGIATDWVNGANVEAIAKKYFIPAGESAEDLTGAISSACRAIFKSITYAAPWGISSLMQIRGSGIDFDSLSEEQRRTLELLPAYIYHGVNSENAVAMRINAVPRSIAEKLAQQFQVESRPVAGSKVSAVRDFLENLSEERWHAARPDNAKISGAEYRLIWKQLVS
jgi:hypothetical protein